jgi:hypothetical protein
LAPRLAVALFVNTALLVILINVPINSWLQISVASGTYTDFDPEW